jgi:WD40 repeat protein
MMAMRHGNRSDKTAVRMKVLQVLRRMLLASAAAALMIGGLLPRDSSAYLSSIPAAFSEDGRVILVQMTDALALWDLETRALVGQVPGAQCDQVVLLKQEGWVLCATNAVTIYDWKHQTTVATIPPEARNPMRVLAYSPESDRMVLRQGDDAVSVWKVGDKLVPLKHIPVEAGKGPVSFAASPDTKVLAIAEGQTIHLHDLTGTQTRDISVREGKPGDLLFAPNSTMLAASVGNTILLIDVADGVVQARAMLTQDEGARGHLVPRVFSRDSSRLVAGNGEWSYPLFDTGTGKRLALTDFPYDDRERNRRGQAKLAAVDIASGGDVLVGQPEYPSMLRIWDLHSGAILPDLCGEDCRGMGMRVSLLKWSPDGSKVVVSLRGGRNPEVDGKVSVWDVPSRSPELVLDPSVPQAKVLPKRPAMPIVKASPPSVIAGMPAFVHESTLRAVAGSPTSPLLVTAGDDGMLKIWDPARGVLLRRLNLNATASALAFSADGAILTAGTIKGDVRLWDTKTWREFPPYSSRQGSINALQLLSGNRLLVIAGEKASMPVVDLVTRRVVKELVHANGDDVCGPARCEGKRVEQGDSVLSIAMLEGSSLLLTASRTSQTAWDTRTWSKVEKPEGFPDNWFPLGWKRPFLATSVRTTDPQALALTVWDPKRDSPVATLDTFTNRDTEVTDHGAIVRLGASLTVDPLNRLAATRVGEYVSVWDLSAKAKRTIFHVKKPAHLHWTSGGTHLVVSTLDRKILVWSAETMEPVHFLRDPSVTQ